MTNVPQMDDLSMEQSWGGFQSVYPNQPYMLSNHTSLVVSLRVVTHNLNLGSKVNPASSEGCRHNNQY